MADKAPETAPEQASPPKKGPPIKTIAAVLVMLVVEGVVIVGALTMFGKPSEVKGVGLEHEENHEGEHLVEIPVLIEKFTNSASGRVWIWDTEIVMVVKEKYAGPDPAAAGEKKDDGHGGGDAKGADAHGAPPGVRAELLAKRAQVRTGIGAIWSSAQHGYFTEPARETLSRQVLAYLREVFGKDPEGHERIESVLIPKCLGFPSDY